MSDANVFFFPGEDHTLACLLRPEVARIASARDARAIAACTVTDEMSDVAGVRVIGVNKEELKAAFQVAIQKLKHLEETKVLKDSR